MDRALTRFVVGTPMHQQPPVGGEHGNRDGAVLQPITAHLCSGDGAQNVVVVVDHVDQLRSTVSSTGHIVHAT